MSKIAALLLAFMSVAIFSSVSKAQIIQSGNVYAGVAYAYSEDVIPPRLSFRGWDGGAEVKPFIRFPWLGLALDASGVYRTGVTQYNLVLGPRISRNYGKWRLFAHALGGIQQTVTGGEAFNPILVDVGGGADRRLPFKKFAWRLQGDFVHSHLLHSNQYDFRVSTGLVWRF